MDATELRRQECEDGIFNSLSPSTFSVAHGHAASVNGGHRRTDIPWTRRRCAVGCIVLRNTTMHRQCVSVLVRLLAEPLLIADIR